MFDFFRKHQRSFFLVITVVIVISFSFFGTFGAISDGSFREQIAFKAVDGTVVTRHELDEMVLFLGTDADDKRIFGGVWGPNFLNDGVIKKNFLETGLGLMLIEAYPEEVKQDLVMRADKERRYVPYVHPQAHFIGAQTAWNYFAPAMQTQFNALRSIQDPASLDSLKARASLFLMERQLPPPLLRQVLRYQEKQYNWLKPDPNLDHIDLSLFGYHTVDDWFGPHFSRLVSEFIINAAIIAEQRGYYVSKADAMADLVRNADISFQQNAASPHRGVATTTEYFDEQLRRLGMDRNMAVSLWQKVLLFRRLFQDLGSAVFVDPFTFGKYDAYASEAVEGELYQLPKELRFNNYRSLQKFETYLDAVSKRSEDEKAKLKLPSTFLPVAEIAKKTPEFIQKRYLLEIAHVDKKMLEGNVSLKQSWEWEVEDAHWDLLKHEFPELALKLSNNVEERYAALDSVDDKTRSRIDAFARKSIVDAHPEWLEKALSEAKTVRHLVGLRENGANASFVGLKNGKVLMDLLDVAPLSLHSEAEMTPAAKEAGNKLKSFTADNATYYRIVVVDRAIEPEVLSFVEADRQGVLDRELDRNLEAHYVKIRGTNPKEFQREDKSWKPLGDVQDAVADRYFEKVLNGIRANYATLVGPGEAPKEMIGDYAATLRFLPYMQDAKAALEKSPADPSAWIKEGGKSDNNEASVISAQPKLNDQWKLEKVAYQTSRSNADQALDKKDLFALQEGAWTKVNTPGSGNINFFHLSHKKNEINSEVTMNSVSRAKALLSNDAQQQLMAQLLKMIEAKNAISLDYLKKNGENRSLEAMH